MFQLLQSQTDDNDGQIRETNKGALVVVSRIIPENSDNPYVVSCPSNGAWWFFSQAELERQARLVDAIKPPTQGDYLGLGGELHTIIDKSHGYDDAWLVEDNRGEDYRIVRDPDNDNDTRRAWKLA